MRLRFEKQHVKIVALVCALVLLFAGTATLLLKWENSEVLPTDDMSTVDAPAFVQNGRSYFEREGIKSLLVMGIDNEGEMKNSGSYLNDGQCDFLWLIVFDEEKNSFKVVEVNRDTMTSVQKLGVGGQVVENETMQIALSHTYGDGMEQSCENTVAAVENLFYDINIDYYLAVNMTGLQKLVDSIGGVEATIHGDFSSVESSFKNGKKLKLNGEQCLKYLRARKGVGDQTNLERSERQRKFAEEQLKSGNIKKATSIEAVNAISNYMLSNMNAQRLNSFSQRLQKAEFEGIECLKGKSVVKDGFAQFHVDEDELKKLSAETFYEARENEG